MTGDVARAGGGDEGHVAVIQKLPSLERPGDEPVAPIMSEPETAPEATTDWRDGAPVLSGSLVTLRELREGDAAALFMALSTDETHPVHLTAAVERRGLRTVHRVDAARARGAAGTSASPSCRMVATRRWDCFRFDRWRRSSAPPSGASRSHPSSGGPGPSPTGRASRSGSPSRRCCTHRLEARAVGDQWSRQRGVAQARRRARRDFAQSVPAARRLSRSGAVDDSRRRVAGSAAGHLHLVDNPLTSPADMDVRDFDFDLPPELIAQEPPAVRGGARLLHLDRASGAITHTARQRVCPTSCAPAISSSSTTRASSRRGCSAGAIPAAAPSSACWSDR